MDLKRGNRAKTCVAIVFAAGERKEEGALRTLRGDKTNIKTHQLGLITSEICITQHELKHNYFVCIPVIRKCIFPQSGSQQVQSNIYTEAKYGTQLFQESRCLP